MEKFKEQKKVVAMIPDKCESKIIRIRPISSL